jgi:hypothetical protein
MEQGASALEQAKAHYGCNLYPILLAPLYRLMQEWGESDWVAISHRMHGRNLTPDTQFMQSCGNFAVNFPVGLDLSGYGDWEQLVRQLAVKFEEVPMNGTTFDWIGDRLPNYLYPDSQLTPVRANYLGNRDLPQVEGFDFIEGDWEQRIADPTQKRTALLEFFFSIYQGRLQVTVEYSCHFHDSATIRQWGDRYFDLLKAMLLTIPSEIRSLRL